MPNDAVAKNMLEQLVPTDRDKSVEDNFYDLIGYKNPAEAFPAEAVASGSSFIPPDLDEFNHDIQTLARDIDNELGAAEYEAEGAFLPAFAKAVYATENFADNLGSMAMVHGTRYALENDWHDLAEWLASDTQWGMTMGSTRGGNYGFYHDTLSPEEVFGEGWRSMSSKDMFTKLAQNKAADIEKYYGNVEENWAGELAGWAVGELVLDAANLAPTGYIGLAGKFGKIAGKTKGKIAAGAITGMGWAMADQAASIHVREQAMDPGRILGAAVFGGLVGGALPAVGAAWNAFLAKSRQNGLQVTPDDLEPVLQDAVTQANKKVKALEALEPPKGEKAQAEAAEAIAKAKAEAAQLAELDSRSIADAANKHLKKGKETDAQSVIDAGLRFFAGTQTESMDVHKYVNKNRVAKMSVDDDLAHVYTSTAYSRLSDQEKESVDTFMRLIKGTQPDPKIKADVDDTPSPKVEEVIAAKQEEVVTRTEKHMEVLSKHSKAYKQDILRNIVHDTGLSAGVGGGTYLATGDEDFALQMAIATGAIAAGSQVARRMRAPIDDLKTGMDSPNVDVRMEAIRKVKASRAKAFMLGTSDLTTNNWSTTPHREWMMRGGVGKALGRQLEAVGENVKIGINNKLIGYGQIMAAHKIPQKQSPIVARLLTHQYDLKHPDVKPEHIKAAQEIRKLLNAEVRAAQKVGVLTKADADGLIANAKKEGYLNRVYFTDYLATKKGSAHFAEALNTVGRKVDAEGRVIKEGMSEADALSIVKALTGETEADAMKALTNTVRKSDAGAYVFDKESVRKLMREKGGIAQPSKFLERGRKLPSHLEEALDPFLVRDLKTALIKYFESTTGRIEHAKAFGKKNEGATAWRRQIEKEWGSAELGKKAEQDILGAQFSPDNTYLKDYFDQGAFFKFSNKYVQHWQNAKLIASGPLNFTQHLVYLPTLMSNMGIGSKAFPKMAQAYKEGVQEIAQEVTRRGSDGHKFLNEMGTLVDSITYSAAGDMARLQPNPRMGALSGIVHRPDFWLRVGGFEGLERWNRRVAGLTGKAIVDDMLSRKRTLMKKEGLSPKDLEELQTINSRMVTLGLDPDVPINSHTIREYDDAGAYVANDLLRDPNVKANRLAAAQSISNKTNFQSDYLHKPRKWNTPQGMWFGKFRNFMLHNTAFVRDEVIKPFTYGDTKPMAMMLATAGIAGAGVNEFREFIRNDDTEMSATTRMFENWMVVGALGGWVESFTQMQEYPEKAAAFVVGPVYSDAWKYFNKTAGYISEAEVQELATMLAVDFAPTRYATGIATRLSGEKNPYAYKGDQQNKEHLANLGLDGIKL